MSGEPSAAPPVYDHDPRARRVSERYARLYAPLALACAALAFVPVFRGTHRHIVDGAIVRTRYDSVVELAGRGERTGMFGVLLLAVLVTLLTVATFHAVEHHALPTAIAILAAAVALTLLVRPTAGSATPALSDGSIAGLVLAVCTVLLGVAHAIQLRVLTR